MFNLISIIIGLVGIILAFVAFFPFLSLLFRRSLRSIALATHKHAFVCTTPGGGLSDGGRPRKCRLQHCNDRCVSRSRPYEKDTNEEQPT